MVTPAKNKYGSRVIFQTVGMEQSVSVPEEIQIHRYVTDQENDADDDQNEGGR